jgi:hypothetical protein
VWKRDHPKGEEINQTSVTQISKRLLSLFSTERRLEEFLDSLLNERRFVSNQPIDMIYSSVFPNLAAFYGDEVVVLQPEGKGSERRSLGNYRKSEGKET